MSTPLPGCMIGPSEPCEMFQEQTAEIARLRREKAELVEAVKDLLHDASNSEHREHARAALRSAAEKGEPTPDHPWLHEQRALLAEKGEPR